MAGEEELSAEALRCARCGTVIGVYEPFVHVIGEIVRETSRAAEPHIAHEQTGAYYHLACHEGRRG